MPYAGFRAGDRCYRFLPLFHSKTELCVDEGDVFKVLLVQRSFQTLHSLPVVIKRLTIEPLQHSLVVMFVTLAYLEEIVGLI